MNSNVVIHPKHLFWLFVAMLLGGITLSACARATNLPATAVPFATPDSVTPAPLATPTAVLINEQSTALATPVPAQPIAVPASPAPLPVIATRCVPQLTTNSDVTIRTGYSDAYSILGRLLAKTRVPVIAQSADGAWMDVYLNDGNGDVSIAAQGARQVCPGATMAYQLKVAEDDALLKRSATQRVLTIHVNGLPASQTSFWSANPNIALGTCTTLYWEVDNVQGVYLNAD